MRTMFRVLAVIVAAPFVFVLLAVAFFVAIYQYQVRTHDVCMRTTFTIAAPDRIPAFRSCNQQRFARFKKPEQIVDVLKDEGYKCHYYPYEHFPGHHGKDVWGCYVLIPVHPLASERWVVVVDFKRNGRIDQITANIGSVSL